VRARTLLVMCAAALGLHALLGVWPPLGSIDPLLVVAVIATLPGRPGAALGAGLLTGILEDAWAGGWFGQHALTHATVAYLLSILAARVDLVQLRPAMLALVVASVADWGMQLSLAVMFGKSLGDPPGATAWSIAIVGNTLLGLVVRRVAVGDDAMR